jgi:hypothetical protein
MTIPTSITPRRPDEGSRVAHTPVSAAFKRLLRDLDACVAAERAIQRDFGDALSSGFDAALRAAETAREVLSVRLRDLVAAPERRAEDRQLRLTAFMLQTLLGIQDDHDRAYLYATVSENAQLLESQGVHPNARMVRALLSRFLESCAALLALEDFGGPGHEPDPGVMALCA